MGQLPFAVPEYLDQAPALAKLPFLLFAARDKRQSERTDEFCVSIRCDGKSDLQPLFDRDESLGRLWAHGDQMDAELCELRSERHASVLLSPKLRRMTPAFS